MVYFVTVSVAVLAASSFLTYQDISAVLRRNSEQLTLRQFTQTENNILNMTSEVGKLTNMLMLDEDLQNFLLVDRYNPATDLETLKRILKKIDDTIANYPYVHSVFLFTQSREGIGYGKDFSVVMHKGEWMPPFIYDRVYGQVVGGFPKEAWYRGDLADFFYNGEAESRKFISQMKGVKAFASPDRNGILVFNIDERYLALVYGDIRNKADGDIYLTDAEGRVLSSADGRYIGETARMFPKIDRTQNFGSLLLNEGNHPRQIVYYKLEALNWYIFREIPLHVGLEDVFTLRKSLLIVLAAGVLSILISSYFWLKKVTDPLQKLVISMKEVGRGQLGQTVQSIPHNEIGMVIRHFNDMSHNILHLVQENERIEREKRELEMSAFQSQINPHFLYNSLNTVKWAAAEKNAENAVDMLVSLGNMLRPLYRSSGSRLCALESEIEYVENYIRIMNARYNNRIEWSVLLPEDMLQLQVPRLILQPIIENAIVHGINPMQEQGTLRIEIRSFATEGVPCLEVADTGQGIPEGRLAAIRRALAAEETNGKSAGTGIGLVNVHKRLKLQYGSGAGVRVDSRTGEGTKVTLILG